MCWLRTGGVPNSAHAGTARELGEAPPRLAALPLVSEPLGRRAQGGSLRPAERSGRQRRRRRRAISGSEPSERLG